MLRKIARAVSYVGWISAKFFQVWNEKGLEFALVFLRVRAANLRIQQANKRCHRDPSLCRVECPCCGWRGFEFFADEAVIPPLYSVFCPGCASHERHRMLHLYLHRHDPATLNTAGRLLHFAPEEDVRRIFANNKRLKYFSTDYDIVAMRRRCLPGTGVLADIQNLGIASDALDLVFCLHVLEHVRKDAEAIKEIRRVLKPGGVAYIMVPFDMSLSKTQEWPVPRSDIHYHIWAYATSDFKSRLGVFNFQEIKPDTFLSAEECARFRIPPKEIIYRCVKEAPVSKPTALASSGAVAHG